MSLRFTIQPLKRRIPGSFSCRLCASSSLEFTTSTSQYSAGRSIHLFRFPQSTSIPIVYRQQSTPRALFRRFASSSTATAPTATTTSASAGPTITIPEFPTRANRPPVGGLSKHQVHGIPPSFEALKADEEWGEDTELLEEGEANVFMTDAAVKQLSKIASRESGWNPSHPHLALRLAVESGGCHGYQYEMKLEELGPGGGVGVDDYVFPVVGPNGEPAVPVVIDLISLGLLKGSTLHFATELIGSAFGIKDNPQAKEAGSCGCGISWEAK